MNILFIGDIFASGGRSIVADHLNRLISEYKIDLPIANAENAASGFGITPLIAEELLALGLDVLTGGNHSFDKREIHDYLDTQPRLLRPANYPPGLPGSGGTVVGIWVSSLAQPASAAETATSRAQTMARRNIHSLPRSIRACSL